MQPVLCSIQLVFPRFILRDNFSIIILIVAACLYRVLHHECDDIYANPVYAMHSTVYAIFSVVNYYSIIVICM